jgi:hypothetical protein
VDEPGDGATDRRAGHAAGPLTAGAGGASSTELTATMAKYIPISLILVTVSLAIYWAGKPKEKLALRRVQMLVLLYILIWCYMCLRVYPQYVFIE